jgi:hypothetical protein
MWEYFPASYRRTTGGNGTRQVYGRTMGEPRVGRTAETVTISRRVGRPRTYGFPSHER